MSVAGRCRWVLGCAGSIPGDSNSTVVVALTNTTLKDQRTNPNPNPRDFRYVRTPEGRFFESLLESALIRQSTKIMRLRSATNESLHRRSATVLGNNGVSIGSVPDTPAFDWHAPLLEWCRGCKIKIGVPGSIPVCTLSIQFTN